MPGNVKEKKTLVTGPAYLWFLCSVLFALYASGRYKKQACLTIEGLPL